MRCICCSENNIKIESYQIEGPSTEEDIIYNGPFTEEHLLQRDRPVKIDEGFLLITGGVIQKITAPYGSIHDGDRFLLAICDSCIKSKLEDGGLLFLSQTFGDDESRRIESSKKIYRRNNNLDKLA